MATKKKKQNDVSVLLNCAGSYRGLTYLGLALPAADKVVMLADGTATEEGGPAELPDRENGVFRRVAQLQAASAAWSIG